MVPLVFLYLLEDYLDLSPSTSDSNLTSGRNPNITRFDIFDIIVTY